jgi:hypothetical protein
MVSWEWPDGIIKKLIMEVICTLNAMVIIGKIPIGNANTFKITFKYNFYTFIYLSIVNLAKSLRPYVKEIPF